MMNYKITSLLLCTAMFFVACSEDTNDKAMQEPSKLKPKTALAIQTALSVDIAQEEIVKKDYTIAEIYSSMCIQCHSADGSGNTEKLTPSMKDFTQQEMEDALLEVEDADGHVIMEHNRGKIQKMGMDYGAKDMSKFMFEEFNK